MTWDRVPFGSVTRDDFQAWLFLVVIRSHQPVGADVVIQNDRGASSHRRDRPVMTGSRKHPFALVSAIFIDHADEITTFSAWSVIRNTLTIPGPSTMHLKRVAAR